MNCTGTEMQRAILACYQIKPSATDREISTAAGVSLKYVGRIVRDYLGSKAREKAQSCQLPARRASMAVTKDVAEFHQPDRSVDPMRERVANTAKQEALHVALNATARVEGESKRQYCRRVAAIAGVSAPYVHHTLKIIECEQIGAECRVREAEAARHRCKVIPAGVNLGPLQHFTNWLDVFSKFKSLAEAYILVARSRGDVFAAAYLENARDQFEYGAKRATQNMSG